MKTPEEILNNSGLACEYGYNLKVVPHDDAIQAMHQYADQFKPKWISVEERLPELGQTVIWYEKIEGEDIMATGEYTEIADDERYTFTHWMPLPSPPSE